MLVDEMRDMTDERIVAIGLLTKGDLERLGETFDRLLPLEDCAEFSDLLRAIDEAEERQRMRLRNEIP
jgi:hypothetical protein